IIAYVSSPVDAGDDQVRVELEETVNAQVHTVGGGPVDGEPPRGNQPGTQRMMQGKGMGYRAALPVRRHYRDLRDLGKCLCQGIDTRSKYPVIIGNQNLHSTLLKWRGSRRDRLWPETA